MKTLTVDITEYADDHFPGWVMCTLTDAFGKTWHFKEKTPVVSLEEIGPASAFPIKGYIAGEVLAEENGVVCFSTEKPWHIESIDGVSVFYVLATQVIAFDFKT